MNFYKAILTILFLFIASICLSKTNIDSLLNIVYTSHNKKDKVAALNKLSRKFRTKDKDRSICFAEKGYILSKKIEDIKGQALSNYNWGMALYYKYDYKNSISKLEDAAYLYSITDCPSKVALTLSRLANLYKNIGFYHIALEKCFKSLNIYTSLNLKKEKSRVYNCLGSIYKYQKDYQKSLKYYNKCLEIAQNSNSFRKKSMTYNNIGNIYSALKDYDKALDFYNKKFTLDSIHNYKKGIAKYYNNCGILYTRMGEYKKAYEHLNKSLKYSNIINDKRNKYHIYDNFGFYYKKLNQFNKSIVNYKKAIELGESINFLDQLKKCYLSISESFEKNNMPDSALFYYKKHSLIKDSIFNKKNLKTISRLEYEFEQNKKEHNLKLNIQKNKYTYTIIIICITLMFVIIMLLYQKQKCKISAQTLKSENLMLEKIKIEQSLKLKNLQLSGFSMQLAKNSELNNKILEKLKSTVKNLKSENKPAIKSIINQISKEIQSNTWEEFELRFIQVHKGFYDQLLKKFPEITQNEKRLCAFLKLDMSTKEISEITYQSPHSINIARTRLRKKLGLVNTKESISVFLNNI